MVMSSTRGQHVYPRSSVTPYGAAPAVADTASVVISINAAATKINSLFLNNIYLSLLL
jgi:hypothetical protein